MQFQILTVSVPDDVYDKLSDVSELSDLSVDDLVSAACSMVYKEPTQSIMKRVMRVAQAYKIARILTSFPKSRRNGIDPVEETVTE